MLIDANVFFIKDFGVSDNSVQVNGINYWKLSNDERSVFSISGYIRKLVDSIVFIPADFNSVSNNLKEYKLFDFNSKFPNTWTIITQYRKASILGYNISYLRKENGVDGEVFNFSFVPFCKVSAIPKNR